MINIVEPHIVKYICRADFASPMMTYLDNDILDGIMAKNRTLGGHYGHNLFILRNNEKSLCRTMYYNVAVSVRGM